MLPALWVAANEMEALGDIEVGEEAAGIGVKATADGAAVTEEVKMAAGSGCGAVAKFDAVAALE